jgi:hypothetical protein
MQANGQAGRSDALARYGVQIDQKLRHVDYAASGLRKFFAGVLSCLTVWIGGATVPPIHPCLHGEPRPGWRQAVKAEAAKRGRDSASLYGLMPVRFNVVSSNPPESSSNRIELAFRTP